MNVNSLNIKSNIGESNGTVDNKLDARIAGVEKDFHSVLKGAAPEIFDVVYDCMEKTVNAIKECPDDNKCSCDPYYDLANTYSMIAYYVTTKDYDKRDILEKCKNHSKTPYMEVSECDDCYYEYDDEKEAIKTDKHTHEHNSEYRRWISMDVVEKLPAERDLEYYDTLNKTMHVMHQSVPALRNLAMYYYAHLCAMMSYGEKGAEKIYSVQTEVGTPEELELDGKSDVPPEIYNELISLANSYGDIHIDEPKMSWYFSHYDMGEDYDYSCTESVIITASGLNKKRVKSYVKEATETCCNVLNKLAEKEKMKSLAVEGLRVVRGPKFEDVKFSKKN